MNRRGFTVIEIIVVLIVISILLSIGVYTTLSRQSVYRDRERQSDVNSIKISLENYYKNNSGVYPIATDVASDLENPTKMKGSPIDSQALIAPGQVDASLVSGTNLNASIENYTYEPLPADCNNTDKECRSYKLHYKKETDGTVVTVASKN